jgi:hypothetical protein
VDKRKGHLRACQWIAACCIVYNIIKDDISETEWKSLEVNEEDDGLENQVIDGDAVNNEQRAHLYNLINFH